ncbi:MAG: Rpn family recombination-promoting nuclease/putative transposase [Planctomycetaceae bacterium]|jgi:predicted transposase/invertase (TIGR01784 family)|nr:Rpn family recombination-promoting nuclease/putative transposase [Planctomycetaceae bacterium]
MMKQAKAPVYETEEPLIKPTSDLFTAVLWSAPKNEPLLRDFLNAVLLDHQQPPIQEATVLNPFNIKEFAFDRQLVLDVRVRDEAGHRYNIEVQTAPHTGFCNRMLFHWADIYAALLRTGDDFTQLVPVKSVVIADFPIFPELRDLHTVFEVRSRENPKVLLSEHLQIHFLRLGDMLKRQLDGLTALGDSLQHWMNFFAFGATTTEDKMTQMIENSPAVRAAYEEFQRFTLNAEMREVERRRRRYAEDVRIIKDAARDEGLAEGKAEGKAERDIEIARNMKQKGYDCGAIAELTGLSPQEIERLD